MIRRGDSGGTMDMILIGMANTVDCLLREVDVVMPGRVMVLLRDHFSALRVVLSRELQARTTGREVATVVIVVVVVGIADSLRHRSLLTIRLLIWRPIPFSRPNCLARRWR